MPKMKSNRGAAKRFKKTASGKLKHKKAFLRHILTKKPAKRSKTGNPLLLGGPQVGHALPSFFMDIAMHAPGVDFRGPAVPGTSALIPLGRGFGVF